MRDSLTAEVNKLRVLFLMRDPLPPARADVKALFGKYLHNLKISSDLIGHSAVDDKFEWPAGRVTVSGRHRSGVYAQMISPFQNLLSIIKHQADFDIVQVRDQIRTGCLAWIYARIMGKPFIYWMSFPFVEGFEENAKNREGGGALIRIADQTRVKISRLLFYRFLLPGADHVFVQSNAMQDWLVRKGFDAKHFTPVPMGVDTDLFNPEKIEPIEDARLDGREVVIYVGSMGKARNSTFLLDIALRLRKLRPNTLLVLAGDARSEWEQQWLRSEISARDLNEHVLLTGWLVQEDLLRYLVRADVGLSPIPRGELFDVSSPTKLVEYLALGIPSIANDIPDQAYIIEHSKAGVCVPMELDSFVAAILDLLQDPAKRRECAQNGPVYVRSTRSYQELARLVDETYRSVVVPCNRQ